MEIAQGEGSGEKEIVILVSTRVRRWPAGQHLHTHGKGLYAQADVRGGSYFVIACILHIV